ncbi:hypothetical protein J2732_004086 [Achromobacter deleyi]|uniref:hypothetical protein n=1 Tax=Achromobacter deleyi TaxID=1353891 RepID=UPI0028582DDB|nr:hypothetical protein [Achromobacter deleyi]MDR6603070.1 hypothetical protein [Achromobacter deleyi]
MSMPVIKITANISDKYPKEFRGLSKASGNKGKSVIRYPVSVNATAGALIMRRNQMQGHTQRANAVAIPRHHHHHHHLHLHKPNAKSRKVIDLCGF